ncbi:REP-associated tyrosine transposase [Pseudomonas sp. PSKL.D1]|uniref:REP-associated tyrosine transposase n=1 Tax=Pseudomonas sp. PSKL.D1 TaxID=3029060 RepID=UPI00238125AC|nr:transposase [Pseudomonas sp. PSKL.D1]WDY60113.1 transposase [Pseudomonas sp. PSKL.D1]
MPFPNGHQLRRGRYSEPGRLYLLTTVTRHRKPLFLEFHCARMVISHLRLLDREQACRSLAWVVMPDHVHWLIELKAVALSTLMRHFKARSSQMLRKAGGVTAAVWQAGYHDRALRREEDVVKVARYIVANPLRAGLVQKLGDYPHWDAIWV